MHKSTKCLIPAQICHSPLGRLPFSTPVNVRVSRRHHADKQRVANQYHAWQKSLENPRALGLSLSRF